MLPVRAFLSLVSVPSLLPPTDTEAELIIDMSPSFSADTEKRCVRCGTRVA